MDMPTTSTTAATDILAHASAMGRFMAMPPLPPATRKNHISLRYDKKRRSPKALLAIRLLSMALRLEAGSFRPT